MSHRKNTARILAALALTASLGTALAAPIIATVSPDGLAAAGQTVFIAAGDDAGERISVSASSLGVNMYSGWYQSDGVFDVSDQVRLVSVDGDGVTASLSGARMKTSEAGFATVELDVVFASTGGSSDAVRPVTLTLENARTGLQYSVLVNAEVR